MCDSSPEVERALISVYDKSGLGELGRRLTGCGVQMISTGGTAKALRAAGLSLLDVAEVTGFPEILDGRVKTLHPGIHAAILGRGAKDAALLQELGIQPIQLVVVNLYPFAEAAGRADLGQPEIIEFIDIGGPAMLRAAAKNFAQVAIVTDPADYSAVLDELEANRTVSIQTRKELAARAFEHIADYDRAIANYMRRIQ